MSTTTVNDHATTDAAPAGARLVEVDPRSLLLEANVRTDADLDPQFLASIKTLGVLTPVLVQAQADGLHVRAGQRRTLAAVEVGRATIPAYVVDGDTDEVRRIIEQMAENDHRRGVTDRDRVAAYQQLSLLGLSAAQIAKRTATKKDRVTAALTVAASPVAAAVTAKYDVTLDQAAVIAEFDGDEDAVKALTVAAVKEPGTFDHLAQKVRDKRRDAEALAAIAADLTTQGVAVIEEPERGEGSTARALHHLCAAEDQARTALTEETHAACPGRVAWLRLDYWSHEVRTTHGCADPTAHGHAERFTDTGASGSTGGPMTAEQKAERRTLIANNKAWRSAETVRRDWLTTFAARKTAPKDAATFLAAALARRTSPDDEALRLARTLLGLDQPTDWRQPDPLADAVAKASPARAQHIALVLILATIEHRTGVHTWRSPSNEYRVYFTALRTWGYVLSDVERVVLTEPQPPAALPDADPEHDGEQDEAERDEPSEDDAA
ncbi:ParB/RepB/Spo0J family partition protein [Cellulomonas sp. 179-A 4D5 NHS]|uniref:ParB/RepB/Spo0J family partition protein n=1 Tax=Cellulomonas sp. 179-A 4D5 NHS TaxID=3142378 RepID=UPI0039A0BE90